MTIVLAFKHTLGPSYRSWGDFRRFPLIYYPFTFASRQADITYIGGCDRIWRSKISRNRKLQKKILGNFLQEAWFATRTVEHSSAPTWSKVRRVTKIRVIAVWQKSCWVSVHHVWINYRFCNQCPTWRDFQKVGAILHSPHHRLGIKTLPLENLDDF